MFELLERVRGGSANLAEGLVDDPDCLADMPGVFSVFRLRYEWGTILEVTLSTAADAGDRNAAFGVLPAGCTFVNCLNTDTLGSGGDGAEFTLRFLTPVA